MDAKQIDVMVADASHEVYVDKILDTIREAAKVRGTGIAERTHEYLMTKIREGKAIIALHGEEFAGFLLNPQHFQGLFIIDGDRFFTENMLAGSDTIPHDRQVGFRIGRNDNNVEIRQGKKPFIIRTVFCVPLTAVPARKLFCGIDIVVNASDDFDILSVINIFNMLFSDMSAADQHDAVYFLVFHDLTPAKI